MINSQNLFVALYGLLAFIFFAKGLYESARKNNSYGKTSHLFWLGIFVWGDAVVIGFFWFISSLIYFFLNDWLLFLLITSSFWLIRSVGETIYWLNQQFSSPHHNNPERLGGYSLFKSDSIWFVYQIIWQCLAVISLIATIYFANLWVKSFVPNL